MDLQKQLKEFLVVFEPFAQKYFQKKINEASIYHPLIEKFYKDLFDFSSGGKRMRAFLVYLGYLVGTPVKETPLRGILPTSLAVEILHSFLLIHDDIIDRSDIRRGKPTIHKRYGKSKSEHYGISQAIVLGDIACFEALTLINSSEFDDQIKTNCLRIAFKTILETGYGEALDVLYANISRDKVSLSQIRQVMDLKTARYSFVGPLILGATISHATESQVSALSNFALACGLAFQLKDDFLGVYTSEKVTGKPLDLHEGKNTLLIHKARELSNKEDRDKIDQIWGKKDATQADLKKVQKIIKRSGALAWCEQEQLKLIQKAKKSIKHISYDQDLQITFSQIADFVINREK